MTAVVHQLKYPQSNSDTVPITITLASLATSSTLLVGREATAIVNDTNIATDLDEDRWLSGKIRTGTSPTVSTQIEVWAFIPRKIASGTATWPQGATGSDAALTLNSVNAKNSGWLKLVASMTVDATSNRDYDFSGNVTQLFGFTPPRLSVFVTHNTAVNLDSTGGNHEINYGRLQSQSN